MPIALPSQNGDRSIWLDSDVQEIVDKLHFGDPTAGWEGDERLGLYRAPGRAWELWRLEESGKMNLVARSSTDVKLDSLIPALVARDMHRARNAFNPVAFLDQNDKVRADQDAAEADRHAERLERVYYAAGKDLGVL